jgi:hypothetical protein
MIADDNGQANSALVNALVANQDALISAVAHANPNTVVVLSTGGPVLMPWLQAVKAVLEMWYPGQEGGTATAKLLLGQANPSGKLPFTWPADEDQTPFAGHPERITGDGTQVVFSEGLFMGYRWYDQQKIQPLFAFGHGLSYTQFKYSRLEIRPDRDGLEVRFALQNAGSVGGLRRRRSTWGPLLVPRSPCSSRHKSWWASSEWNWRGAAKNRCVSTSASGSCPTGRRRCNDGSCPAANGLSRWGLPLGTSACKGRLL